MKLDKAAHSDINPQIHKQRFIHACKDTQLSHSGRTFDAGKRKHSQRAQALAGEEVLDTGGSIQEFRCHLRRVRPSGQQFHPPQSKRLLHSP